MIISTRQKMMLLISFGMLMNATSVLSADVPVPELGKCSAVSKIQYDASFPSNRKVVGTCVDDDCWTHPTKNVYQSTGGSQTCVESGGRCGGY